MAFMDEFPFLILGSLVVKALCIYLMFGVCGHGECITRHR